MDVLGCGFFNHGLDECREVIDRETDAIEIVRVGFHTALRRPAEEERSTERLAINSQVEGDLSCSIERELEGRAGTVNKDESVILEVARLLHVCGHSG